LSHYRLANLCCRCCTSFPKVATVTPTKKKRAKGKKSNGKKPAKKAKTHDKEPKKLAAKETKKPAAKKTKKAPKPQPNTAAAVSAKKKVKKGNLSLKPAKKVKNVGMSKKAAAVHSKLSLKLEKKEEAVLEKKKLKAKKKAAAAKRATARVAKKKPAAVAKKATKKTSTMKSSVAVGIKTHKTAKTALKSGGFKMATGKTKALPQLTKKGNMVHLYFAKCGIAGFRYQKSGKDVPAYMPNFFDAVQTKPEIQNQLSSIGVFKIRAHHDSNVARTFTYTDSKTNEEKTINEMQVLAVIGEDATDAAIKNNWKTNVTVANRYTTTIAPKNTYATATHQGEDKTEYSGAVPLDHLVLDEDIKPIITTAFPYNTFDEIANDPEIVSQYFTDVARGQSLLLSWASGVPALLHHGEENDSSEDEEEDEEEIESEDKEEEEETEEEEEEEEETEEEEEEEDEEDDEDDEEEDEEEELEVDTSDEEPSDDCSNNDSENSDDDDAIEAAPVAVL